MKQVLMVYCFKGDSARKRYDDSGIEKGLFEKIKSDEMKPEEAKNCKPCLNQI